jgi:hypothetical protein
MCKNREEMVSPEKCNGLNRPATTLQCHMMPCALGSSKNNHLSPPSATWIPSEWAQVCHFKASKKKNERNKFNLFNSSVIFKVVHKHEQHDVLIQ